MKKFSVTFSNENRTEEFQIPFVAYENSLADKWYLSLKEQLLINPEVINPNRLTNFFNNYRTDLDWIKKQLRIQVDRINSIWPQHIDLDPSAPIDSQAVHYLHRFFENFIRDLESGNLRVRPLNSDIKQAFQDLNILIHRFEALPPNVKIDDPFAPVNQDVVATFWKMKLRELAPEDYESFTVAENFGEVYLDYCHSGRHLWEALVSKDAMALETNLRPQTHYGPGIRIWFGATCSPELLRKRYIDFEKWMEENSRWIERNGIDPLDPMTRNPGFGRLGKLCDDFLKRHSDRFIIQEIGRLGYLKEVQLTSP